MASTPHHAERQAARPTSWGPTRSEVRRARDLVGRLPLSQLAGQVIVAGYHGTGSPAALVSRLHLGGAVPVAENITSSAQVRAVNASVQRAVRGRGYPAFIGIDQEGGTVVRIRDAATRYPSFMSAGAARDPRLTRRVAAAGAREMRGLGFTSVLAPVADVTRGPADPVIGTRSASGFPRLAAVQVVAAQAGLADAGVIGALKHFPGHGSVTVDSHQALPVLRTSLPELRRTALVPFRRGIEAGASAVMVGHLDVRAVDPHVPASLSRKVVTGLLRGELGFRGVVMTDALSIGAGSKRYGSAKAAARAVNAGVDVVLMPADARAAPSRDRGCGPRRPAAPSPAGRRRHSVRRPAPARAARRRGPAPARLRGLPCPHGSPPRPSRRSPVRARAGSSAATCACPARPTPSRRSGRPPPGTGSGSGTAPEWCWPPVADPPVLGCSSPSTGRTSWRAARRPSGWRRTARAPGAMEALVGFLLGTRPAPGKLPVTVPAIPRTGC